MSLAQQAVRGAAWNMALNMVGRAVGLVGTLVITRFLAPETIGEVQVAVVLVTTANYFSLMGLGHYVLSRPEASREETFHSTVMTLAFGALALAVVVLLRGTLAPRFDAPAAARLLPGMALAMALDRLAFVPTRVMLRELRFRTAGSVRTAGEVVFPLVAVGLALRGYGGMALVMANVARSLVRTGLTVALVNPREWLQPSRLSLACTRRILAFGLPNGIAGIAGFAATYWDNLLMARLFGPGELGYYQLAYNLSALPSNQVGEHVGDVLLPSFARLPPERRAPALARSVRLLALIMFPLAFGLAAMAPTIVHTFLSPAWAPVGARVAVLAVLSAVYPLGFAVHSYLNAINRPRLVMWLSLARTVVLLSIMTVLGKLGGPLWACAGVGVAFGGYSLAGLALACRLGGVRAAPVLVGLVPPLAACAPMVAAVLGTRWALLAAGVHPGVLHVGLELLVGGVAFVAAAWVLTPALSREFVDVVNTALLGRQRRAVAEPAVG
jgi:PST family polysaccharide transporter